MTADEPAARSDIGKSAGRPRDDGIDSAVLDATRELLVEIGYARLTIAAIAERAGTTKTAIYRRWKGRADLVHDAGLGDFAALVPHGAAIGDDIATMANEARAIFNSPVTRAALPGVIADMAADPELHRQVLAGFATAFGAVYARIDAAAAAGEITGDTDPALFIELLGGAAIVRVLMRPDAQLDEQWAADISAMLIAAVQTPGS